MSRGARIVRAMGAAAIIALGSASAPATAGATGVLDQSQTSFDVVDNLVPSGGVQFGSTFTAGVTGDLDRVVLNFAHPAPVTAGTQYAIIVWSPASTCPDSAGPVRIAHTLSQDYDGGTFVHSANGGANWLIDFFDGTFKTYVAGTPQLLSDLLAEVNTVAPLNSLTTKLRAAQTALEAGRSNATCGNLADFVSATRAQTGKKISVADAAQLIAHAQRLQSVIGC
jgi:FIMAH domain